MVSRSLIVRPRPHSSLLRRAWSPVPGYVGNAGRKRCGKKKWRRHVADVVTRLRAALEVDDVVVGGGNAEKLRGLPKGLRLRSNADAFTSGYCLWTRHE